MMLTTVPPGQRTAFTLIELLLVLALLVVIAGLAVMVLDGSLLYSKLTKGVEQVRTAWSDARRQAIENGERVAFTCLLGGNSYRLSTAGSLMAEAGGQAASASTTGELPDEITFASVEASPNKQLAQAASSRYGEQGTWSAPILFNPDGTSYDAVLVLQLESGKQMQLSLRGLTCTASVSDNITDRGQ